MQRQNTWNILLARDPSENIGLYWYLFGTMFQDRLSFFRPMMICLNLLACLYISHLVWQLFDVLDWGAEARDQKPGTILVNAEKAQRRRQRAYMMGFLLVTFTKIVMNPYPTLHDFSMLAFLGLMNITFMTRQVEAFLFIIGAILFGMINTLLLAITWLHRFSGNANFLYFQIIALDAWTVILFLQVFMGIDAKRKKYARELLRPEDRIKAKPEQQSVEKEAGKTAREVLDEPISE